MKPTYIGYNGQPPLAVINWYTESGEHKCYTFCYDEQDVENAYARYTTPGDLYNKLFPSIEMVGEPLLKVS